MNDIVNGAWKFTPFLPDAITAEMLVEVYPQIVTCDLLRTIPLLNTANPDAKRILLLWRACNRDAASANEHKSKLRQLSKRVRQMPTFTPCEVKLLQQIQESASDSQVKVELPKIFASLCLTCGMAKETERKGLVVDQGAVLQSICHDQLQLYDYRDLVVLATEQEYLAEWKTFLESPVQLPFCDIFDFERLSEGGFKTLQQILGTLAALKRTNQWVSRTLRKLVERMLKPRSMNGNETPVVGVLQYLARMDNIDFVTQMYELLPVPRFGNNVGATIPLEGVPRFCSTSYGGRAVAQCQRNGSHQNYLRNSTVEIQTCNKAKLQQAEWFNSPWCTLNKTKISFYVLICEYLLFAHYAAASHKQYDRFSATLSKVPGLSYEYISCLLNDPCCSLANDLKKCVPSLAFTSQVEKSDALFAYVISEKSLTFDVLGVLIQTEIKERAQRVHSFFTSNLLPDVKELRAHRKNVKDGGKCCCGCLR